MSTQLALGTATTSDWVAWTPSLSFLSVPATDTSYSSASGRYIKVGNLLIFNFSIAATITKGGAAGNLLVSPPPVAYGTNSFIFGGQPVMLNGVGWPAGASVLTMTGNSASAGMQISGYGPGVAALVTATNVTSGAGFFMAGSGMYYTV